MLVAPGNTQVFGKRITMICGQLTTSGQCLCERLLCGAHDFDHFFIGRMAIMFVNFERFSISAKVPSAWLLSALIRSARSS
jgi:hypothetical protein